MSIGKGKDERGHAFIDGLILLIVLIAVPLALLLGGGGKVRAVTDWGAKRLIRACERRIKAPAPVKSAPVKPAPSKPAPAKTVSTPEVSCEESSCCSE